MTGKIIIVGPAYPLRGGGITTFNQRLCKQFMDEGFDCAIYSFSLQYPSFLFPGKSQYSTEPPPEGMEIYSVINSMHPLNWWQVGTELRRIKPDIIVVRFWLPLMGPALGTILRRARKNKHTRVIAITDNIIPHEKRRGDKPFTRYFLGSCDAFITMSDKVTKDLQQFNTGKPVKQVLHPLYDNFGEPVPKPAARKKLGIDTGDRILLFFGFIRHYKGLDLLLEAMGILMSEVGGLKSEGIPPASDLRLQTSNIKLLIAGEFYEDRKIYDALIEKLGIGDRLILHTDFIPDSDVRYYLSAADVVVQPYRNATQSGVTPLAYHFGKPMIVTNVGGLPGMVPHLRAGLVCEPDPASIAKAIVEYFEKGEQYFIPFLHTEKEKYSWHQLSKAIIELTHEQIEHP